MKTIFKLGLTFIFLIITISNSSIDDKSKLSRQGSTRITDNDLVFDALEGPCNYFNLKTQFTLKTIKENTLQNKHNSTITDKELIVSLVDDPETKFTYYITDSKSILIGAVINTNSIVLPKNIKVGMSVSDLEDIYKTPINKETGDFTILDADGLIQIKLNYEFDDFKVHSIEIKTSGYVG